MTVNAAHVLGARRPRPDRAGLRADVTLLDAPDWRYLAYHLAGDLVSAVVRGGTDRLPALTWRPMPTRKQRRRREKDFRHDVRVYEVDEEGNEVPIAELRAQEEPSREAEGDSTPPRRAGARCRAVRAVAAAVVGPGVQARRR